MPLICGCDYNEEYPWYYFPADVFAPLATVRRRRCVSCERLIAIGEICFRFGRFREALTEVEEKIYGENGPEVPLADYYHCEKCGEIFLNLSGLGFCVDIENDMNQLMKEYQNDYAHPSWRRPKC